MLMNMGSSSAAEWFRTAELILSFIVVGHCLYFFQMVLASLDAICCSSFIVLFDLAFLIADFNSYFALLYCSMSPLVKAQFFFLHRS